MTRPVLGRLVEHDDRSKAYPAPTGTVQAVDWTRHGQSLNQGNLGSCTGNALVDALNCNPLWRKGATRHEKQARQAYSLATKLDGYAGEWPPTDTGSSGLAVCKAGVQLGWISGYTHAFGLDHCLAALALSPVIVGTPWLEGMFTPDPDGTVHATGAVAGGHEYCLRGIDAANQRVRAVNSWGRGWADHGEFWLSFADLGSLLDQQGDVTVPHL